MGPLQASTKAPGGATSDWHTHLRADEPRKGWGTAWHQPKALWVASRELKALQTLQCLAATGQDSILQDARFNEVQRNEPFDDDFRSRRRSWVEGKLDEGHPGWETPEEVASRFEEAVREYSERDDRLVIGSHGMVITAWLIHARLVQPGVAAGRFWEALAFPDLVDVDLH